MSGVDKQRMGIELEWRFPEEWTLETKRRVAELIGRAVLVSSQNYSADGVRFNRDAGLLIRHADVAAYFEKIFLHDWENRTSQRIAGEAGAMPLVAEVAAERAAARGAAETISWDEFYGD